ERAGPVLLKGRGNGGWGIDSSDDDEPAARRVGKVRRNAQGRLRRGDGRIEHLPQQRPRHQLRRSVAHGALEADALEARTLARMPIPAISTLTVLPSLIDPIPTDVPQAITSPGNS